MSSLGSIFNSSFFLDATKMGALLLPHGDRNPGEWKGSGRRDGICGRTFPTAQGSSAALRPFPRPEGAPHPAGTGQPQVPDL